MTRACLFLVLAAWTSAGCVKTTMTSPTETADTDKLVREFSSVVTPGSGASRSFDLSSAGSVAVALLSTSPPGVAVGLGIGIPRADGSCALSAAITATTGASPQISIAADIGAYCAKVFDPGTLTEPVPFTISISRP